MNLDLFVQNLVKEITQTVSTVPGVEPGQEGEDFESMLVKQSKDAQAQRRKERPEEKPASKKEVEKNQEDSTQEEEVPKDGSQLAAALVTSQPVVLFGMPVENAGEAQAAAGVLDAAAAEILPEAAEGQLDQPGQQLSVEETAEEAVQPVLARKWSLSSRRRKRTSHRRPVWPRHGREAVRCSGPTTPCPRKWGRTMRL